MIRAHPDEINVQTLSNTRFRGSYANVGWVVMEVWVPVNSGGILFTIGAIEGGAAILPIAGQVPKVAMRLSIATV